MPRAENIQNAMVQDGHWQDDDLDAAIARVEANIEAACERLEASLVQAYMEAEEFSREIDANIERMDKLNDELKFVARFIDDP